MENYRQHPEYEKLRDKFEDLFPKGECKERGKALVLWAEFEIFLGKILESQENKEKCCKMPHTVNELWACECDCHRPEEKEEPKEIELLEIMEELVALGVVGEAPKEVKFCVVTIVK